MNKRGIKAAGKVIDFNPCTIVLVLSVSHIMNHAASCFSDGTEHWEAAFPWQCQLTRVPALWEEGALREDKLQSPEVSNTTQTDFRYNR